MCRISRGTKKRKKATDDIFNSLVTKYPRMREAGAKRLTEAETPGSQLCDSRWREDQDFQKF